MALQNRISFSITPEELAQAREMMAGLLGIFSPKLVQLSADVRKELPKMGDKSYSFVAKGLEYAVARGDLLPKYVDTTEAQNDFTAVSVLREFYEPLMRLSQLLEDTMTLSGSEAYVAMLSFYHSLKGAAKDNIQGAQLIYDELKTRFPGASAKPSTESVAS